MEPERSLPHSQQPAICPYPEPDRSSPCSHPTSLRSILTLLSRLRLGLPSGLRFSVFPPKACMYLSTTGATCPAHLSLLDLVTRMILGEEYRTLIFSLCSLLHSPLTSCPLGPNILLSTLSRKSSVYVPPSVWVTKFHFHTKTGNVVVVMKHPQCIFKKYGIFESVQLQNVST
jgi:hypothetical protein